MKKILLLFTLLAMCSLAFAQRALVTQCEWFTGADPGVGNGNAISIGSPDPSEALAFSIATGSMNAGDLVRAKIRCKIDSLRSGATNVWGVATDGFVLLSPATGSARVVTIMGYQWNNGTFNNVDVVDAGITNFAQGLSTTGLPDGLNRLRIRAIDDLGRTGVVVDGFVVISNTAGFANRLVTQMEYRFDSGTFTPVDVADGGIVNLNEIVATTGLTNGVHRFQVRSTDDLGRVGQVHDGYLVISNTAGSSPRVATSMEYRIDGGSYTNFDYPDNGIISFNEIISTNALAIGLHQIDFRTLDDLGRVGQPHRAFLIVSSPFVGGVNHTVVAAEVFVGSDPGPGNGVDIPLPQDGAFNEGTEDFLQVYTDFPVGYYRVGFRIQTDDGRWSQPEYDSLLVGPILTIFPSGNDAVLNWTFPDGIDKYYVYRAAATAGPFNVIDSTTARTYTDTGIVTTQDKSFYYVTFRDDSVHIQQPGGTPVSR
ncbi:MAG: hypothetical protein IPP40_17485 [bacterium]|nr:hypothetical protein [bacterium]